jgi:hypothetical protein
VPVEGHGPEALDLFDRIAVRLGPVAGHAEPAAQFLELGTDGAKLTHGGKTSNREAGMAAQGGVPFSPRRLR